MANLNIKFNNKNYSIDPASLADATARLEAHLVSMVEERLEGDGAEYYTLAPTALSFRSTAPLNELQEVQINGVTVDPANYTLEEGSTIVTFPIDYLKTLNVGSYEVAIASESKTVKGGFNVAAPELNEHGFYYNQPYTAYVPMLGTKVTFFVRDDGTFDSITGDGGTETGTYEISENTLVSTNSLGVLHSTISANGMEIFCTEIATTFVLGDTSIAADADYIYIYKEDLGGYEVNTIDKTKAEYGAIKTGINGIKTVALKDGIFYNCSSLKSITIPNSVTSIGSEAFLGCTSLTKVLIPGRVTDINYRTFYNCTSLTDIEFGNNIKYIHEEAFYGCTSLTIVLLNHVLTNIGKEMFRECRSLSRIDIFNYVTKIEECAFYDCISLTSINFNGTVSQWNAISKYDDWNYNIPATHVYCTDGDVAL